MRKFLWSQEKKKTIREVPLTCGKQNAVASYEENTVQKMDNWHWIMQLVTLKQSSTSEKFKAVAGYRNWGLLLSSQGRRYCAKRSDYIYFLLLLLLLWLLPFNPVLTLCAYFESLQMLWGLPGDLLPLGVPSLTRLRSSQSNIRLIC